MQERHSSQTNDGRAFSPVPQPRELPPPRGLIFTDLDSTLLDHYTYDFSPAKEALTKAKNLGVEIILCSSKTLPEMTGWQKNLGIAAPFVTENGGGVFNRGGNLHGEFFPTRLHGIPAMIFGDTRQTLVDALRSLSGELGFACKPFAEMSVLEVSFLTGLAEPQARLSMERDFDEPFVVEEEVPPEKLRQFINLAKERGFNVERGGRFYHLFSHGGKGAAVRWLLDAYKSQYGRKLPSLALGDGENDLSMLGEADRGVLVRRPKGEVPAGNDNFKLTDGIGPEGWNEAVLLWLGTL